MKRFIFIAVSYNTAEFSIKYINSVNEIEINQYDSIKIIIVDNNSDPQNIAALESYCKEIRNVRIVKTNKNLGYFNGLNIGVANVEKDNDTMLIVGNNDLTFDKYFIKNLKKIEFDNDIMVIAPSIVTKNGRQQNPHVIEKVSMIEKIKSRIYYSNYYIGQMFKLINRKVLKKSYPDKKIDCVQKIIKRGIGACYILTPNFFRHFSRLDDRVFLWGEEALLSNQLESVNGYTLYDPTIKIIHHENGSVGIIQSKEKYVLQKKSYKIYRKYL